MPNKGKGLERKNGEPEAFLDSMKSRHTAVPPEILTAMRTAVPCLSL